MATVTLHETVGPLRTTVKAVAERAGVQRATVYRHFADEHPLCSAFYRDGEQMLHNLFRDEPHVESLQQMMPVVRAERDAVRALLMRGRPERGRRRVRVAAAIGHAVDFGAWRSLARGDLDDVEIVELMVELVRAAGASRGKLR